MQFDQLRRRDFITLLGGAAVGWPLTARAQQQPMPVIGLLHSTSRNYFENFLPAVRQGLGESGWTDGQNVAIEYRWAEGQPAQLPALAANLAIRQVAVIFTVGGSAPAGAAKAATSKIPIVFISAADPIKAGLVASLNRPGGNVTGVSLVGSALEAKRLALLDQLAPKAALIGVLVNPNYPDADGQRRELQEAADTLKQAIAIVTASTGGEIDTAFVSLVQRRAGAVLITQDILFNTRHEQIVALAERFRLPAMYNQREYAAVGKRAPARGRANARSSHATPQWVMHRSSVKHSEVARLFEQISASIDSQRAEPDNLFPFGGHSLVDRQGGLRYGASRPRLRSLSPHGSPHARIQ